MANTLPVAKNPSWDGSFPYLGFRIIESFPRFDRNILEDIASFGVCDVADQVGELYAMEPDIHAAYPNMKPAIGNALTIKAAPGDSIMIKKAIELVQDGDIIVIDNRGFTSACVGGGNIALAFKKAGATGMVIDGAWRDVAEAEAAGFPIYLKGIHPVTTPKRGPGEINTPVCCGSVVVEAGDVVFADREGIVVIPARAVIAVHERLMKKREPKPVDPDAKAKKQQAELERRAYMEALFAARNAEIIK